MAAPGTAAAAPPAAHVIVVGVDGLSPDGVLKSEAPNLKALMARGAWTMHARGVFPTVSAPNWASMIRGAGPEEHGISSNEWRLDTPAIPPLCASPGTLFPSMFRLVREQRPSSVIAVFHDWNDFARLVEPGIPDTIKHGNGPEETMSLAIDFIRQRKPDLLFIHLDSVDEVGHHDGHGTPAYYKEVARVDELIGRLLGALEELKLAKSTAILISSDHGGVGKKHGGMTLAELEIPWILAGAGVKVNSEIAVPVSTIQTAPTVLQLLGVKAHPCWVGRPVPGVLGK